MDEIRAKDCRPIERSDAETRAWLERLAGAVRAQEHLIRLGEMPRDDDEPVVYCERDGRWWCGRYVGTLTFEGRRLTIEPRYGIETLGVWLQTALDLRLSGTPGDLAPHEAFLPELLGRLWGSALVFAARHGPPALRVDARHHGLVVRGRLDVRATAEERVRGRPGVSSVQRVRSLENPIVEAIVAAFAALRGYLGSRRLRRILPERARDLLDAMTAVVPLSVAAPDDAAVAGIRFTPITAGYRSLVQLSLSIARNRGLFSVAAPEGKATGVLLDVAELWELFVIECLRRALPTATVRHGTRDEWEGGRLLRARTGATLGRMYPDAVVREGSAIIIADAKYKPLQPTASRPHGVLTSDLYQMRAYISRWSGAHVGALVYPREAGEPPRVVTDGPWTFDDDRALHFVALPVLTPAATAHLASLFDPLIRAVE